MSQQQNRIECPNCGHEIDVNEILYHQLDEELKKKYNDELAREKQKLSVRETAIRSQQETLSAERASLEEKISEGISAGIKTEKSKLQAHIRAQAEEEQAERIKALQTELTEKSEKVKELNRSKSEIERLKREKEELREAIELENEQKLNARLNEEREKIRKTEENRATLKLSEKDQVINQLREQLLEAQRKAEQGSMQIQGEVQELAIEDWLTDHFPLDTIEEIKKGAQGADCMQIVNTHSRQNCGTIYYESKRTKNFQPSWIEKFKNDIREKGANIGVLVTEAMPADMERMGLREGIWVCTFEEFKGLCVVLRESLIQLSHAITTQENKGDKMGMLYDFLTSNEFRLQIEAIVEGFTQMQSDLDSEKRAMQGIWKKREKQIEKVLLNTNHMYSSIRGIAGSAIQTVPQLEFGEDE
ncbi:MAG: DUF2130 domain-containing protein [Sedimenticola sp.]